MRASHPRRSFGRRAGMLGGLLAILLGGSSFGCIVHHHDHGHGVLTPPHRHAGRQGPPPHAPAHGHRRKHHHDDVELVYDSEVGVYVVLGREAVYWDGDRYLRWRDGEWQMGVRLGGAWVSVASREVPAPLHVRHEHRRWKKAKKRGHRHRHGHPASYAD